MSIEPGTLYLVGTPIGNREDLTPRARRVLGSVSAIACEDTRRCRHLFDWVGLPVPELIAYHDHNDTKALPVVLDRLRSGDDVALVTDAGMPAIQDPGYRLVRAAREASIPVVPVPGPSALLLALAAGGLATDRFVFLGFAPRKGREAWWRSTLRRPETVVVYEAPKRVAKTLAAIESIASDRRVVLARELTKLHEEFVDGSAASVSARVAGRDEPLRGECVLLVDRAPEGYDRDPWDEVLARIEATRAGSRLSSRDRVELLAAVFPGERNAIYGAVEASRDRAERDPDA